MKLQLLKLNDIYKLKVAITMYNITIKFGTSIVKLNQSPALI